MNRIGSRIACAAFCVLTSCIGCGGGSTSQTTPPPTTSHFAYITYIPNGATDKGILMTYSEVSGTLTAIGNPLSAPDACGLTVSPNNAFLYVAECADDGHVPTGSIMPYSIDQKTGILTAVGSGTIVNTPSSANGYISPLAVAPTGRFAYVLNEGGREQSVVIYSVGSDGSLSPTGSPVTFSNTGYIHNVLAIAPSGHYLYVADWAQAEVNVYAIDANSGALTAVSGSPFAINNGTIGGPAMDDPAALAVALSGDYLYAPDSDGSISMFSVAPATGVLTSMNYFYVNQGNDGGPLVFNSAGTHAYMLCAGNGWITAYSVNTSTGALNQIGLTKGPNTNGTGIALDPSGSYLYALWSENPSAGGDEEGEVSTYSVDSSTGVLTYIGPAAGTSDTWPTGIAFATE